jgi:hypothetical protein
MLADRLHYVFVSAKVNISHGILLQNNVAIMKFNVANTQTIGNKLIKKKL